MPTPEPGSPEWWLRRLHVRICKRRPLLVRLIDYYDGDHPLEFTSEEFRNAFGGLFKALAENWCRLVPDVVEERLNIGGFRVGDNQSADSAAWALWQANEMDAQSSIAHLDALICGGTFATAWYGEDGQPEFTIEHPLSAEVETHPKHRRRRRAGLRVWRDDDGHDHAELFLPDAVWAFISEQKVTDDNPLELDAVQVRWRPDVNSGLDVDDDGRMANPLGVVPMVPLPNRPRVVPDRKRGLAGQSEIVDVIPLQDAVNKLLADMIVTSEFHAGPQRWATGLETPKDPVTNQPIPIDFAALAKSRLLSVPDTGAKFGNFDVADTQNYTRAIEMVVSQIASISRTPPHYMNPSADRLSGESIKAAETGLVAKTGRKMRHFGEGWEELIRIGGRITDNPELQRDDLETIWGDPESRTESEHIDAISKMASIGVHREILQERAGLSQVEIARNRMLNAADDLDQALAEQTAAEVTQLRAVEA